MKNFFNFLSLLFLVDGCATILIQSFGLFYLPVFTPLDNLLNTLLYAMIFWFIKSVIEICLGLFIYLKINNKKHR